MHDEFEELDEYTGRDRWNAIYTVQIGELVDAGVFDWSRPELDWSESAYDDAQYKRVCDYFIERFYYREISIEPFAEWARRLHTALVYELMPKFAPLYKRIDEGIDPLANGNEYYKSRKISSAYPETLLSENADYITDGIDLEEQRIREADFVENVGKWARDYKGVDELLLDELERFFVSLYTMSINTTW